MIASRLEELMRHWVCTDTVREQRQAICHGCKWYREKTDSCGTLILGNRVDAEPPKENTVTHYKRKVRLCGCKISWKTKWKAQRCPAGKWLRDGITDEDIEQIKEWLERIPKRSRWTTEELKPFYVVASKVKGQNIAPSTCVGCFGDLVNEMKLLINEIENAN